jgi:formylmethanofuran--tetrahydromethanopterin N-formyltransferase
MTCPTTAVFNGLREDDIDDEPQAIRATPRDPGVEKIALGKHLRFFGDGFQKSKLIGARKFWRIPVMDGEFIVEDSVGVAKGVAGGNFLIFATDQLNGLRAAEKSVDAIAGLSNVITPFPGGVVRSGSKIGSRYAALKASTSDAFCPTLRGRVETAIPENVNCVYEIVIDGTDFESVALATEVGIRAAAGAGVVSIGAGNYGGKLGKHHFHLKELFKTEPST